MQVFCRIYAGITLLVLLLKRAVLWIPLVCHYFYPLSLLDYICWLGSLCGRPENSHMTNDHVVYVLNCSSTLGSWLISRGILSDNPQHCIYSKICSECKYKTADTLISKQSMFEIQFPYFKIFVVKFSLHLNIFVKVVL